MSQQDLDNNNYINEFNDNFDNIFIDKTINTAEFEKSLFDNNNNYIPINNNIEKTPNFPKSKSSFQFGNINTNIGEPKTINNKKYNNSNTNHNSKQNLIRNTNKRKTFSNSNNNSIRTATTPNHSFLTKSKLSTNSKNNSYYKNTYTNFRKNSYTTSNKKNNKNNNVIKKDQNKEIIIINKLTQEVEHIKNYCNELQRQFDNHCLIKNEKKEFENIKKENIKLTAEVSILKDDVAELMKKFGIINNKIDTMQQENNNLKMQNKNLLNFISIMSNSNSVSGIKKLKNFNFNNTSLTNNNNQELSNKNFNNESMNIVNLINNKNSMSNNNINSNIMNNLNNKENKPFNDNNNNINLIKNSNKNYLENNNIYNLNNNINNLDKINYNNNTFNINNLNSDQIEFSISKSMSKNFEKPELNTKNYYKTINNNESRFDYTNANTNSNTNINIQSKTQSDFHTIGQGNKNIGNNATDIVSLIQSNFNLTHQARNSSNSKNQNRFLIPKNED